MTATYGTISTVTYASHTNTTITPPASIANGDFLLLVHLTAGSGTAVTATLPAGWTQIGSAQTGSDGSFGYRVLHAYKIAASESGNYVVTHTTSNSAAAIVRVTGTGTLSLDVQSQNNSAGPGVTTTALSVTTTASDDLLFFTGLNWQAAALTPPTGMTERLDSAIVYIATQALVASGATGDRTQTRGANDPWFGNLIAVKDAAAGGSAVGAAAGTGAATGVSATGRAVSASGIGAAAATGAAQAAGVGTASGSGAALGVGAAATAVSAVGTASGTGTASAVGDSATTLPGEGVGSAAAVGAATGVSAALAMAVGTVGGSGEALAYTPDYVPGGGVAEGGGGGGTSRAYAKRLRQAIERRRKFEEERELRFQGLTLERPPLIPAPSTVAMIADVHEAPTRVLEDDGEEEELLLLLLAS